MENSSSFYHLVRALASMILLLHNLQIADAGSEYKSGVTPDCAKPNEADPSI